MVQPASLERVARTQGYPHLDDVHWKIRTKLWLQWQTKESAGQTKGCLVKINMIVHVFNAVAALIEASAPGSSRKENLNSRSVRRLSLPALAVGNVKSLILAQDRNQLELWLKR